MKQINITKLVVIYDGINNSVFHSQVLAPILKFLNEDAFAHVMLVSFERHAIAPDLLKFHDRLSIIIRKKTFYFGRPSLLISALSLILLLRHVNIKTIIARGPLAGWVVRLARKILRFNIPCIIQARGLAAEEFLYATRYKSLLKKILYHSYKSIEYQVYNKKNFYTIESVSDALKQYLIETFNACPSRIVIASYDIPEAISPEKITSYRKEVREEFCIPQDTYIYCYMGSAHVWQCVDQMVAYAKEQIKPGILFLFLSRDKKVFEEKCKQAGLATGSYLVLSINPDQTYRYLSAADAGLLFRKDHIINRVARPTKLLEYQAVGLDVINVLV